MEQNMTTQDIVLPSEAGIVVHRSFELKDHHFITNSWNKSYRKVKSHIADTDYYPGQDGLIYRLAERSDLIVACDQNDPFYIYGWICGKYDDALENLVVHYIYVKHGYRNLGIARSLLRGLGYRDDSVIICTHWTPVCNDASKNYQTSYNDYLLKIGHSNV